MMDDQPLHILLVEDNPSDALLLKAALAADRLNCYDVMVVESMRQATDLAGQHSFDAVLLDLGLPDCCGLESFVRFHRAAPHLPVIVFSGNLDESDAVQAVRLGAQDYLVKSVQGYEIAPRMVRYTIERHRAQQALQFSEVRYQQVLDTMLEGCQIIGYDWRYIYVNQAAAQMGRIPATDLVGRTMMEAYPSIEKTSLFETLQTCMETRQPQRLENRFDFPDGSLGWFELSIQPTHEGLFVLAVDITSRKQAEDMLRESEVRFSQMANNMQEIFWIFDHQAFKSMYVSPGIERVLGYQQETLKRNPALIIENLHPEDRDIFMESMHRQAAGQPTDIQYRARHADGRWVWLHDRSAPVCDEHGQLSATAGIAADMTERKQAELALRQSEEKYRLLSEELEKRVQARSAEVQDLYDHAPTGYHSLDDQGRFTMINQTELDWLGYTREEMIGRSFSDIITPASRLIFQKNFPIFKAQGWIKDLEFELVRKDGTTFPIILSATAICDEAGQYLISRSTVFDHTRFKEAETALRQSRDELSRAYAALEKASRAKDEFLANMSHELRTPLNGILGISEVLLTGFRGPLNDYQQKMVHLIESSGQHLLGLINDILDLSKIEAGKLEVNPELISINKVCQDSLVFVKEPAFKKSINLNFVADPYVNVLMADERRLKQMLVNLLNNAVKFTPNGGQVTLKVEASSHHNSINLSVVDSGIGIAPQDMEHLFKPFTQVDSSLTRANEGTGLGLALVKRLADLHGGSISVESQVGQGSTFTISLPWQHSAGAVEAISELEPAAEPAIPPSPPAQRLGVVLLVEDSSANVMVTSDYLENHGYQVIVAENGSEALEKTAAYFPDLILMDVQMPVMDGLEATRRLRADPRFGRTPIIALTALAMPGDRERCLAAGATAYITKPVHLKRLLELVDELRPK